MCLNIQYGNGVLVVVRGKESLPHGKGEQLIGLIQIMEGARGIEKSTNSIKQSGRKGY